MPSALKDSAEGEREGEGEGARERQVSFFIYGPRWAKFYCCNLNICAISGVMAFCAFGFVLCAAPGEGEAAQQQQQSLGWHN